MLLHSSSRTNGTTISTRRMPQLRQTIRSGCQNKILQLKKCSWIFFYEVFISSYVFIEDISKAQNFAIRLTHWLYAGATEFCQMPWIFFCFECLPYSYQLSLTPICLSCLIIWDLKICQHWNPLLRTNPWFTRHTSRRLQTCEEKPRKLLQVEVMKILKLSFASSSVYITIYMLYEIIYHEHIFEIHVMIMK